MKLAGKVALVTGAGRGIGRAIALELAGEGANVAATDVDLDLAKGTSEMTASRDGKSSPMMLDVTSASGIDSVVDEVVRRFDRIDILVNNAGVLGHVTPVMDLSEEEWDRVHDVNAKGVFLCSRAVAKHMIRQREGRIVNIVSTAGKSGNRYGLSAYHSSKHAAVGFTRCLALELAPFGISVNAVCPGYIDTQMNVEQMAQLSEARSLSEEEMRTNYVGRIPLGRLGRPEEIAELVSFLCWGPSYITGQSINICGGLRTD